MNAPSPRSKDFRRLFRPSAIAIVGASADEGSISGQPLKFLRSHGYSGAIYPVNPKYPELAGLASYADISSLPTAPDVALVAVAAKRVPEVLRQCGEKGVPFAIVLTSGFAEIGEEGARAQGEIAEIAFGPPSLAETCQDPQTKATFLYGVKEKCRLALPHKQAVPRPSFACLA
jgi:acyl-CoA synthetase (NDP forming)